MSLPIAIIVGATGASGGTNAGTGSANGTYVPLTGGNATFNSATQFGNGTDFFAWDGSTYWNIWTGVNGTGTKLYQVSGGSSTSIPTTGWAVSSGASPAPTLALVTTGLSVYYQVTNTPGTSGYTGTFYPLSGANALYYGTTQYSNGINFLAGYSSQWSAGNTVNYVGPSSAYDSPYPTAQTTFALTGWTDGTGTSPAPTFSAPSPPTAPSALTLVDNTPTSINVTIPALSGGATSYNLLRAPDSSGSPGTYTTISTGVTPSSTYPDTSLTSGAIYWYALVGVNTYGSTQGVGTSITETPAAPGQLTLTPTSATQITAAIPTLASVTGATSFNVQRAPDSSGSPGTPATISTGVTPNATWTDPTTLVANTEYHYRLVAVDAGGTTFGAWQAVTTPYAAPAQPAAPTAGGCTITTTSIAGTAPNIGTTATGTLTYNVYESSTGTGSWTAIATGIAAGAAWSATGLAYNSSWYFRIDAVGAGGTTAGIVSAAIPVTTVAGPSAPTGLLTVFDGGSLFVSVNANASGDNVATYNLYSSPTSGGTWTRIQQEVVPDFEIARPTSTTYYRVTATNTSGIEGNPTAAVAVTVTGDTEMERGAIFQGLILAAETSLGVLPGSPKVFELPTVVGQIKIMQKNKTFTGRGQKGVLGKTRGKEYTEIDLAGPCGFDELVFLSQGHLAASTPAAIGTSTIAKQWNTKATSAVKDTPQTFTVQIGTVVDGATQIPGCFVSDLAFKLVDGEFTFTAKLTGQLASDSINNGSFPYLGAATIVTTYPVHETGVGLYYGTNLSALTGLTHLSEFSLDSKDRFKPAFFRDPTKASFSGIIEGAAKIGGKLTVEEDSVAAALLALTRTDGQTYLALQATGVIIDTGDGVSGANILYGVTFQWPIVLVKSPARTDKEDVYVGEYDFEVGNDATIGCWTSQITSQIVALF